MNRKQRRDAVKQSGGQRAFRLLKVESAVEYMGKVVEYVMRDFNNRLCMIEEILKTDLDKLRKEAQDKQQKEEESKKKGDKSTPDAVPSQTKKKEK